MRPRLLASLVLLLSGSVQAQDLSADPAMATAMSGSYQLASEKTAFSCRFQLGAERSEGGFKLYLPAGCRTAFPFLRPAIAWTLDPAGSLVLLGPKAGAVAVFPVIDDRYMLLKDAPGGGNVQIVAEDPRWMLRRKAVLAAADPPEPAAPAAEPAAGAPAPEASAAPPKPEASTPADMEGWYQVQRAGGKASSCKLALLSAEGPEAGTKSAGLDERCADQGMKIFRPVAWRVEEDSLILTAKRGHELGMKRLPAGGWTKAVQSGEELVLKKVE
jgi:hypothetical protein